MNVFFVLVLQSQLNKTEAQCSSGEQELKGDCIANNVTNLCLHCGNLMFLPKIVFYWILYDTERMTGISGFP